MKPLKKFLLSLCAIFGLCGCLGKPVYAQDVRKITTDNIVLVRAIDGDTIKAELSTLPESLRHISIRILGIDTPELHRYKCEKEKENADKARLYLHSLLATADKVRLENLKWDKFGGRILAKVFFDGKDASDLLIRNGFAVPYHGEKKIKDWCAN